MSPLTYGHLEITQVTAERYTRIFGFFLLLQYCLHSMKMIQQYYLYNLKIKPFHCS